VHYTNLSQDARETLLAGLAAMPDYLANAFAGLPLALHARAAGAGAFSPVEQVWHLADLEAMGFEERIHRLRSEPAPQLPDFAGDLVAQQRNYRALSLDEGLAAFRAARRRNLATLAGLAPEEWSRSGEQEGVGAVMLCDLPAMMAAHDESHRREIRDWLVHIGGGADTAG